MFLLSGGTKSASSGQLKPPDLWIHDQVGGGRRGGAGRNSTHMGGSQPPDDATLPRGGDAGDMYESNDDSGLVLIFVWCWIVRI